MRLYGLPLSCVSSPDISLGVAQPTIFAAALLKEKWGCRLSTKNFLNLDKEDSDLCEQYESAIFISDRCPQNQADVVIQNRNSLIMLMLPTSNQSLYALYAVGYD